MENSSKDKPKFFDDWEVIPEKMEALHKTGIQFTLLGRNEKGDIESKFSCPKTWVTEQKAKNSDEAIEETLRRLKKEFGFIMKDIPIPVKLKPFELLEQIKLRKNQNN